MRECKLKERERESERKEIKEKEIKEKGDTNLERRIPRLESLHLLRKYARSFPSSVMQINRQI
jgi:hypothetical protein